MYFHPMTRAHEAEFDKLFEAACASVDPGDTVVQDRELAVWGRPVRIPLSTSHVAQFTFHDLCGAPHSAADYLEITKTFGTIFLRGVPQLGLDTKDQARRFILFIDAAYEARVRSLAPSPSSLFRMSQLSCCSRVLTSVNGCTRRPSSLSSPTRL